MKKRIVYIVSYFLTVLLMFVIQKPLFMLYNDAFGKEAGLTDFGQVMWHGISLDATTAGYFTALPLLVVLSETKSTPFTIVNVPFEGS